jgi:hypothetical protein
MNQTAYAATDFFFFKITDVFHERLRLLCLWVAVFKQYCPPCIECGRHLPLVRVTNLVRHSPL